MVAVLVALCVHLSPSRLRNSNEPIRGAKNPDVAAAYAIEEDALRREEARKDAQSLLAEARRKAKPGKKLFGERRPVEAGDSAVFEQLNKKAHRLWKSISEDNEQSEINLRLFLSKVSVTEPDNNPEFNLIIWSELLKRLDSDLALSPVLREKMTIELLAQVIIDTKRFVTTNPERAKKWLTLLSD